MADIFVSYSHADLEAATEIGRALEAAGFSVWSDRRLIGGVRYGLETERALEGARAVLVLWSKASERSMWVADEAAIGRDKGNLIPISLDGALPPIGFRQIQTIDFSAWKRTGDGSEIDALLAAIRRLFDPDAAAPERAAPLVETRPVKPSAARGAGARPALWAAAGGLILLLAGALLLPQLMSKETAGAALVAGARITVTPLSFSGPSDWLDELSGGVTQSIRHHLRQNGFQIVGYDFPPAAERAEIMRLAEALDPDLILSGAVTELGGVLKFNIELLDPRTRATVVSVEHDEPSRADIAIVDRVISEIVGRLEGAGAAKSEAAARNPALYYEAIALLDSGNSKDLEEAIVRLRRVIDAGGTAAFADLAYAIASADRAARTRSRREEAERAVARAFEAPGGKSDAFLARGVVAYVYGEGRARYQDLERDLEASLRADPQNFLALKWMGNAAFAEGDYDGALRHSRAALALSPYNLAATGNEASSLVMIGRRDEALAILDAAIGRAPDWGWGHRFRATLALTTGDLSGAVASIRAAETVEPREQNATLRSIIFANLERFDEADRAIDASGVPGWAAYKKAIIRGDVKTARAALEALAATPESPADRSNVLTALGYMKLYERDDGGAKADCLASAAAAGENARAAEALSAPPTLAEVCAAIAAARLGDKAPAHAALKRFSATAPAGKSAYRPYWTQTLVAALELSLGERSKALATLEAVVASGWATPKTAVCRLCVHLDLDDRRGLFADLAGEARFKRLMAAAHGRLTAENAAIK